jgi:hypothetical protein
MIAGLTENYFGMGSGDLMSDDSLSHTFSVVAQLLRSTAPVLFGVVKFRP